jgi:hypothetical protein
VVAVEGYVLHPDTLTKILVEVGKGLQGLGREKVDDVGLS